MYVCFFFFNDTATTEIYTLSLHDALPIYDVPVRRVELLGADLEGDPEAAGGAVGPVLGGAGRVVELVALEVLVAVLLGHPSAEVLVDRLVGRRAEGADPRRAQDEVRERVVGDQRRHLPRRDDL